MPKWLSIVCKQTRIEEDPDHNKDRPLGVNITDRSGIAGVGYWVNQQLERQGLPPVDKRDDRVAALFAWVEQQYADGRVISMSPEEMLEQVVIHFPEICK